MPADIRLSVTPTPDKSFIHDNESFSVQWKAFNAGSSDAPAFGDVLVITSLPEGCPGSDDQDHPVVFNSETDGSNPQDFLEITIARRAGGELNANHGRAICSR